MFGFLVSLLAYWVAFLLGLLFGCGFLGSGEVKWGVMVRPGLTL